MLLTLALIVTGLATLPQAPASAEPEAKADAKFQSSFEADDTQPESNATVESEGVVRDADSAEEGMTTALDDGPSESRVAKEDVGFTGVKSLHYAGEQTAEKRGYAYNKIYDVKIPVAADTTLSYKIFPELIGEDLSKALPAPSAYVSVDLAFDDGTYLRDLEAEDQHRFQMSAQAQGEGKVLYADQWNAITSRIGDVAEGKTITGILVDYDNPTTGAGPFEGWLDDVEISDEAPKDPEHLSDWVLTNRGTNNNRDFSRGNNIPATAVPHAFNFWAPMTDAESFRWFYQYQEANNEENFPEIQAFTMSHQGYPWGGERHTFQVMPAVGEGQPEIDRSKRAMAFSHDNEIAKPHYYSVKMNNGVQTEIAPTDHGAIMQFSFTDDTSNLIFDNLENGGGLTLDPDTGVLSGYTDFGVEPENRMFVYATFDQPVTGGGKLTDSDRPDVTGYYQFDTSEKKTVTMRIATSLISVDQAKHNLDLEVGADQTFDSVKDQAQKLWDEKLGVITDVEGATDDQLTSLYSNLYRLNLYPNSTFENTGTAEKPNFKHASMWAPAAGESTATETGAKIVDGESYKVSNFWDTYRTAWPADSLFYPELTGELINGALTQYTEGEWLDTTMVGSSSDIAFADAYAKGITNFDVETAYEAALKNATVAPAEGEAGRPGLNQSNFLGYTPSSTHQGLSNALEDYFNDFGIATMSKALAEDSEAADPQHGSYQDNATYFLNRSQSHGKMFDPEAGFFQGRGADGEFDKSPEDYDPRVWGCDYTETNGWGMTFSVPHDGQGLANLYGGRDKLEKKLDTFFSTPETAMFPGCYGNTIHEMLEAGYAQMGMFGINNQPSHHIPYMYNYTGNPSKTQATVRESLSRHFVGSEIGQGYLGDDDTGEMSAWYIFGALGFYPLAMGTPDYAIGSPLFTSATINLENGKKVVINAPENSPENVYVQGLKINGQDHDKSYLSHDVLTDGAELTFDMGPEPSDWAAGEEGLPPSVTTGDDPPNPLQDLTAPSRGTADTDEGNKLFDNDSDTELALSGDEPSVAFEFLGRDKRTADYYTLTSGLKDGDPTGWELQGSQDGKRWTTLDQRSDETFTWRSQTRVFKIDKPGGYGHYRLKITGSTEGAAPVLSEVQLLGTGPATEMVTATLSPQQSLALPADEATETEVTLGVTVDRPRATRARITAEGPDGWTVDPADGQVIIEPEGDSATGELPLTVTVPAGTEKGDYRIVATVAVPGESPIRTFATVRVSDSIEFLSGTPEEIPWLLGEGGSQVDGDNNRFADNDNYFTYRFALPSATTEATATLDIDNQFRVEASNDGENWTEVLVEEEEIRDGSNREKREVDLSPYLGDDKVVYLKVSDSFPDDGWGGRVKQVTVAMGTS